jgi:hypothetical protein
MGMDPVGGSHLAAFLEGFQFDMAVMDNPRLFAEVNVQRDLSGPVIKCMQCYSET